MVKIWKPFVLACLYVVAPFPAFAKTAGNMSAPIWDVSLGVGVGLHPTFDGSDRYRVSPLPLVAIKWRDAISLDQNGLNAYWHHRNLRIGLGLTFDPGRDDKATNGIFNTGDNRLAGLGEIDKSLGLRAFGSYRLGLLNFDLSATKFTGKQNDGILANVGVSMPLPITKKLVITPHVRTTWANRNYMQTYFGVTALQSEQSIFRQYTADAGFSDVSAGINVLYAFNKHWYVAGDASFRRQLGDAAESPISISDTSATFVSMIGYHF